MYHLSWTEIFDIVDASELSMRLSEDRKSGVRSGDLKKFDKFNEELIAKQGK